MSQPHHPKDLDQGGAQNTSAGGATGRAPATAPPLPCNEATTNAPPATSPYVMPPSTAPYPPSAPTPTAPYPYPTTSATPYPSTITAPTPSTAPYPPTAPNPTARHSYPTTTANLYPSISIAPTPSTAPYPDPTSPPLHPTPFSTPLTHGQSTKHLNYGLNVGPIHQDSSETGGAEVTDREPVVAAQVRTIFCSKGVKVVQFLFAMAIVVGVGYLLALLIGKMFWW